MPEKNQTKDDDDGDKDILTTILENSNVKSAFDHEKVMRNSQEGDFVIIEAEATQKARQAFDRLKSSKIYLCLQICSRM